MYMNLKYDGVGLMKVKKGQKIIYQERGIFTTMKDGRIEEVYGVYAKVNGEWINLNYVDVLKVEGLTRADVVMAISLGIVMGVIITEIILRLM